MAIIDLLMPKMGESIMEATILKWVKSVNDTVALDETVLEIATDKVDSEIPSPIEGKLIEILFNENDIVPVGTIIARISTNGESPQQNEDSKEKIESSNNGTIKNEKAKPQELEPAKVKPAAKSSNTILKSNSNNRFYSPLVRSIASKNNISQDELDLIEGSGKNGRVNKSDISNYLAIRQNGGVEKVAAEINPSAPSNSPQSSSNNFAGQNVEIIEMGRMRKLIADHMVMSKKTSPHVTSFVEVDVTNLVNWRNNIKNTFFDKYGEKITFTPIFIEAIVKAIRDFPMINISVDENRIIRKKDINIGMAAALPSGNLIVPVIKNADGLNLVGLTQKVNDLASRARKNNLIPEEIQGGTFTLTNVGTFGNVMGTPIINQPQAAILAAGAIRKKPAVLETEHGDVIAVRQMMFISLSYDHRVVDGFLGGSFLRKVGDYLESFDPKRSI